MVDVRSDIERLAQAMKGTRENGVLLLGFDATAALLGHLDHRSLADKLRGNSYPNKLELSIEDQVSSRSHPVERLGFVREITATEKGSSLNYEAISILADLVEGQYISAIVATDPDQLLYIALRQCGLELPRVQGDGFTVETVDSYVAPRVNRLFFDASGILIRGFRRGLDRPSDQNRNRQYGNYISDMQSTLKKFFRNFRNLYCWGWCEANVPLFWICEDAADPTIHAIGSHTDVGYLNNNLQARYDNIDNGDRATAWQNTAWLTDLAVTLRLEPGPRPVAMPVSAGAPSSYPRRLLFSSARLVVSHRPPVIEQALESIRADGADAAVTIVGYTNELVRRSAARWLWYKELDAGLECVIYENGNLANVERYVTMQTLRCTGRRVVACLTGGVGDVATWSAGFATAVNCWLAPDVLKDIHHRVTLFCPPEVAEWAIGQWNEADVWCVSNFDADPPHTAVYDWAKGTLADLGVTVDDNDLGKLAQDIADQAGQNVTPGLLPEALEFWASEIGDRLAAAPDAQGLTFDMLARVWVDVVQRQDTTHQDLTHADTFELEPVLIGDFELGPTIPINPPEDADNRPTEDAGKLGTPRPEWTR